jgi:hypothetical protein
MLKELSVLDGVNALPDKYTDTDFEKVNDEELITHARIFISKLSADFKSTHQANINLYFSQDSERILEAPKLGDWIWRVVLRVGVRNEGFCRQPTSNKTT